MKVLIYLKLSLLVLALIVVLSIMKGVTPAKVSQFFGALGAAAPAPKEPPSMVSAAGGTSGGSQASPAGQPTKINLCRTRIHAIQFATGPKIEEFKEKMKMKWMAYAEDVSELNYLDIEKWLGQHCSVGGETLTPEQVSDRGFEEIITMRYVDNSEARLLRGGDHFYQLDQQTFRSPELTAALEELIGVSGLKEEVGHLLGVGAKAQ